MLKFYYKFLFASLIVFSALNFYSIKNSYAKLIITPLANETELLNLMRYDGKMKFCEPYLDRYVVIKNIEYYDFDGNLMNDGEITVNDAVAEGVVKIFEELKAKRFPIAGFTFRAGKKLVNKLPFGLFGWKKLINNESLDNLTGAFYCRNIANTNRLSLHSYGIAIDINTLQNPCINIDEDTYAFMEIVPKDGVMFLNRKTDRPNKPYIIGKVNDKIVSIFQKNGFDVWGGDWDYPVDYQHFQVSNRSFTNLLMTATKEDARKIFAMHRKCFNKNKVSLIDLADNMQIDLLEEYKNDSSIDKQEFFALLEKVSNSYKTMFVGKVINNNKKDKNNDFYTMNIKVKNVAKVGSHASQTTIDGKTYNSVSYVDNENIVTHVFGFNGNAYGKQIKVKLIKHLNKLEETDDKQQLQKAMKKDAIMAYQYFQWER